LSKAQELEQAMADAQLKAPFAGYIVEAPSAGRSVRTTTDAFQIGDVSQLEISASALEEDLKQLTEGMTATVKFEGTGNKQTYTGVIRELPYPYGSGKNSGEVRVKLDVPQEQGKYQLGDRAVITVVLQQTNDALWLPPQALRTVGGRTFVLVEDGPTQKRVDVALGMQTNNRVEITAGLTEGQVVIGP
jgi:macrolide-specific efflux system membrane fusion protein